MRQTERLTKLSRKIKDGKEKQMKFIELDETLNELSTTLKIDNNLEDKKKFLNPQPLKVISNNLEVFDTPE